MFNFARVANFLVGSFAVPAFFLVFWPQEGETDESDLSTLEATASFFHWGDLNKWIAIAGLLNIAAVIGGRAFRYWQIRWGRESTTKTHHIPLFEPSREDLKYDFSSFVWEVFVPRGEDPRIPGYRRQSFAHSAEMHAKALLSARSGGSTSLTGSVRSLQTSGLV